jgi:hypothetical protein
MENEKNNNLDIKVTVNQKNTNITEVKKLPTSITDFQKKILGMEIYGRAIDPFTGAEFVKTRTNQRFECPESRVLYHNKMNNKLRYDLIQKKTNKKNILKSTREKLYEEEQKILKLKNKKQLAITGFFWFLIFAVCFIVIKLINSIK